MAKFELTKAAGRDLTEEQSRMKKGNITRFRLDPNQPPKTDWRTFALSEDERHRAALSDPDSPPASEAQLARARRVRPTIHG
jgi:hypothetical protein